MKRKRHYILCIVTFMLLVLCGFNASAQSLQTKIVLELKNQPLKDGLDQVGKLSGFRMNYSLTLISTYKNITLPKSERTVDNTLKALLTNTNLTYSVSSDKILIIAKPETREDTKTVQPESRQDPETNNVVITGVITDMDNNPLPSVSVQVKNTGLAVLSNANGEYSITIPQGTESNPVLIFSFIGMKPQEVRYTGKNLNIVLEDTVNVLEDVIITGISTKKKNSYTGAVSVITNEELQLFRGRNIFTTLSNIDPSFNVIENNVWGADPNRLPEIQIRGTGNLPSINQLQEQTSTALNTPLIILNGFETNLQRMMDLNDQEISSISILKDGAATALYGSRGANGIIVITTKEPEIGKLRLSLRSEMSLNLPDLSSYHLLNSRDKLKLEEMSGYYENALRTPAQNIALQQYYNEVLAEVAKGVNTDWLAKPLHNSIDQNHYLKLEGGDRSFQYAIKAQYNDRQGVMRESGRKVFNGGIDLTYKHQRLTFRNSLMIGHTNQEESPYGSFSQYAELNPYWKPYDKQGHLVRFFTPYSDVYWGQTGNPRYNGAWPNPMYNATLNTYDKSDYTDITNNFAIEWKPLSELFFRGSIAIGSNTSNHDVFKPADHSDFAGYTDEDLFRKGSYSYSNGKNFNYQVNFSVNFSRVYAEKHSLYAMANVDVTQNRGRSYSFLAEGFPDESIDFLGMALQYQKDGSPGGSESTTRRIGVLGNANYIYDNRYMLDFSYRMDGASQYGTNRRFAPFWSVGAGWNLHNEAIIRDNLKFVNRLKIRGSIGTTGSQDFAAYMALATYRYYTDRRYNIWTGAYQVALGNKDLQWQVRKKYNLGLETDIFNSRLRLEADIYKEKTSNLLSDLELPYSNGFSTYTENVGNLESRGFELSATVFLIQDLKRGMSWSVRGMVAHDKDKIVKLSEAMKAANEKLALLGGSSPNKILREGDSPSTIYVVQSLGIDPSTGRELYLTKEGEVTYTWNARDRIAVGNSRPKYRGSFSSMFRYKDFTLNVSFGYQWGGQLYNQTLRDKVEVTNKLMNVDERVFTDRWKQPGDEVFFRGINDYDYTMSEATSRFVQNENTLICQNATLMYEIRAKKWLDMLGVQNMQVSASTGELFYISSVKRERGTNYPFTRQLIMSLSLMF
ncbi:SusC/RagA family TonB-linked outer membrane protein [Dysgonomonas termitidis]|uniref:SusC/RagA family TonB-linked outer membrane protein n=1 Tax=Dysgonomonas termitidis TaxID=1516126 RepID=A0ABV9KR84_9BACT